MKCRPPVTPAQRVIWFGVGVIAIALVAEVVNAIDEAWQARWTQACVAVPYEVGERPACVTVGL